MFLFHTSLFSNTDPFFKDRIPQRGFRLSVRPKQHPESTHHPEPSFRPSPSVWRPPTRAGCRPVLKRAAVQLILLTVWLLPAAPASGSEDQSEDRVRRFTLEEIIRLGVEASPKLWAQRYIIEQAEAELGQAKAGRYPRMEYLQIAGPVPEARGNPVYSPDDRSDILDDLGPFTRLELTINQPIYTFGKLKAYIEAAEKGLESRQAGLRRFELELVRTIKELYYQAQFNEELHRLVSDTEEQFSKAVEKSEEQLEQDTGKVTQQDLLKLKYGLSRARGQLLEIDNGRVLTHAALKRLLVLPEGEDFELADAELKPIKFDRLEFEKYREQAQSRPECQELESGVAARQAELEAERRKYYPDLFVTGLFRYAVAPNRDEQDNPFAVEDFNYLTGGLFVGMRLELDLGLPDRIAGKRAELFNLLQERKEAVSGMLLEVEKAYRDVVAKEQQLDFAKEARKNGRALAVMSAANFNLGLGEAEEIFEAFGLYTEAAARYYEAIKAYNLAVAELVRVTGTDAPDGQP